MVLSRGAVSGGLTIADVLREFEARGYKGQFAVRTDGRVECLSCGRHHHARDVPMETARRIEGASDPADMVLVGAMRCPACDRPGTIVISYGPMVGPENAEALREMGERQGDTARVRHQKRDDASLVRDTGWLRHDDD